MDKVRNATEKVRSILKAMEQSVESARQRRLQTSGQPMPAPSLRAPAPLAPPAPQLAPAPIPGSFGGGLSPAPSENAPPRPKARPKRPLSAM
jgi:hypothetical protein